MSRDDELRVFALGEPGYPPPLDFDAVRRSLAARPPSALWAKLEPVGAPVPDGRA